MFDGLTSQCTMPSRVGVVERVGDLGERGEPVVPAWSGSITVPPPTSCIASQPGPHSYMVTTWGWAARLANSNSRSSRVRWAAS